MSPASPAITAHGHRRRLWAGKHGVGRVIQTLSRGGSRRDGSRLLPRLLPRLARRQRPSGVGLRPEFGQTRHVPGPGPRPFAASGSSSSLAGPVRRGDGVVFEGDRSRAAEQGGRVYEIFQDGRSVEDEVAGGVGRTGLSLRRDRSGKNPPGPEGLEDRRSAGVAAASQELCRRARPTPRAAGFGDRGRRGQPAARDRHRRHGRCLPRGVARAAGRGRQASA